MLTRLIPLVKLSPFHLPVLGVDAVVILQTTLMFLLYSLLHAVH